MKYSIESLIHFKCEYCKKWWTIGDAPLGREYYCPWCGKKQKIKVKNDRDIEKEV